ncbi:poly(A) polymerase [Trypanosoma grayi]|uniref:poly(A) polymerase n=1 Tax=Trypanosoma grayi TaxID=71804 RepID=UPI0004F46222|nr:poly(A) polymerase [Trypanosoma grayi]KEG14071.1 poly(A) polymerase [Trypanosoma grayi]
MDSLHGPTRPMEVPPPQERDDAESRLLRKTMEAVSGSDVEPITKFVESVAHHLVKQVIVEPEGQWARAYPFGSCGLGASVADSDLDMYGESFPFSLLLSVS